MHMIMLFAYAAMTTRTHHSSLLSDIISPTVNVLIHTISSLLLKHYHKSTETVTINFMVTVSVDL